MYYMLQVKKNYFAITACICLYIVALFFSWYNGLITEDIWHLNAVDYREAYELALQTYNNTNARIGEFFIYFIGVDSEIDGACRVLWLYRFFNPIFITACALFIYRLATGAWSVNTKPEKLTFILIIVCILSNKNNYYWLCSNFNWYYPTVIALMFFIVIEPFYNGNMLRPTRFVFAILLAPIVGMSNESVSYVSVTLFASSIFAYHWKAKTKKTSKQIIVLALVLISFAIIFYTAPGPYKRVADSHENLSKIEYAIQNIFSSNWLHVLFWSWRLILVFLIVLVISPLRKLLNCRLFALFCASLLLGGILMLAPNFGAPRAFIPVEIVIMALIGGIIYRALNTHLVNIKYVYFLIVIQFGLSFTVLLPNVVRSIDNARFFSMLQKKADSVKRNGEKELVLTTEDIQMKSIWSFTVFRIPRTLIEIYPLYTEIKPLISTTCENYKNRRFEHKYAFFSYAEGADLADTDMALNKGIAKHLGLESIIVLRDYNQDKREKVENK